MKWVLLYLILALLNEGKWSLGVYFSRLFMFRLFRHWFGFEEGRVSRLMPIIIRRLNIPIGIKNDRLYKNFLLKTHVVGGFGGQTFKNIPLELPRVSTDPSSRTASVWSSLYVGPLVWERLAGAACRLPLRRAEVPGREGYPPWATVRPSCLDKVSDFMLISEQFRIVFSVRWAFSRF